MVSSEAIVRGISRTLEYAEYTEEERPVSIQIFGGDPTHMAEAAQVIERLGADVVDINMGCPVPKIAKHNAGCSLMREPAQAAAIVAAMANAVKIPVTVKMRAGWNDREVNAPELARMVEAAGASAVAVHGRTAAQAYHGHADWALIARVAEAVSIPVYGCGELIEPAQILDHLKRYSVAGVLVGRGILRNPWLFGQTQDLLAGRPMRQVTHADRGRFLLEYIDLLLQERAAEPAGFRHALSYQSRIDLYTSGADRGNPSGIDYRQKARGRERWVINKVRALCAYYTRGFENGGHLRVAVNRAESIDDLRGLIRAFFGTEDASAGAAESGAGHM
jgi:tRNA-dihydrouridine synthase B